MRPVVVLARELSSRTRRIGCAVIVATLTGAFLEMFGVALAFPVLLLAVSPASDSSADSDMLRWLSQFGLTDLRTLAIVVMGFFVLKNVYAMCVIWLQYSYFARCQLELVSALFRRFVHRPYEFFLRRNVSVLSRALVVDVSVAFNQVLVPLVNIAIEAIVCVGVVSLLAAIAPLPTVVTLVALGGIGMIYARVVRAALRRSGRATFESGRDLARLADDSLAGIKEAKVLGRQAFFLGEFVATSERNLSAFRTTQAIGSFARPVVELFAVIGCFLVGAGVSIAGGSRDEVVPTLGLFGVAVARVMPSVTRIMYAASSIRGHFPSLRAIASEFSEAASRPVPRDASRLEFVSALRFNHVTFRYAGSEKGAVTDASFEVPRGSSVAIVGRSGAGKSTIVDLLLGLLDPQSGDIFVDSHNLRDVRETWQNCVGLVPQPIFLRDASIRENVAFGIPPEQIQDEEVWHALSLARLDDFVRSLPGGLSAPIGQRGILLSGGERQRIGLARALLGKPSVVVFDEATSALDVVTEAEVRRALDGLPTGTTRVFVSHKVAAMRDYDKLIFVEGGRVVAAGHFDELVRLSPVFRAFIEASDGEAGAP